MAESNGNGNGQSNVGVEQGLAGVGTAVREGNATVAEHMQQSMQAGQTQLKAIMASSKNNIKALKDNEKAADKDRNEQISWFQKLFGHFAWSKKFQERIAKQGKLAASAVVDFGKEKLASVQKFAGNMLDLLLKGLGLAILWGLFKWLSENNWQETVDKVKGWVEDIGISWDGLVATLDGIWILLTRLSAGFWVFKGVANLIQGWFGFAGPIGTLLKFMWGFSFKALFGIGGAIWSVLTWITGKFGINGMLSTAFANVKAMWKGSAWFGPTSPLANKIRWIKSLFGGSGTIMTYLTELKGGIAQKFTSWFSKEGALQSIFKWIGSFFGSADEGGKIMKAIQTIQGNKIVQGIGKFLGNIGGKMLKFFGPIGWLMAGYDAIMAFWDAFQSEEGSLWDKTVAGLSAGIKAIVDFFFFDLVQLAEDSIKWLIKKVMGLFGFDEKEIEGSEFMQFSITGFLKDAFGDYMKIFEGIFKMDPALMLEGMKGIFGKAADIVGWLFDIAIKPALNWLAGFLGITDGEDLIGDEFNLGTWIKESVLDPLFGFFEKLFDLDFKGILKSIPGYDLVSGFFTDSKEDIEKEIAELKAANESDTSRGSGSRIKNRKREIANLEEELAKLSTGGTILPGGAAIVGEGSSAGELVVNSNSAARVIPAKETAAMLGGGGQNVVAPTTIVNKSSGSTTMMMGSSSEDKSNWKYGMQGA